jgi:hypothetical protein
MPRTSNAAKEKANERKRLDRFLVNFAKTEVYVRIPLNLKQSFLIDNCPQGVDPSKWLAGTYYIVDAIIGHTVNKKFKQGNRVLGYVPLSSKVLKTVLGESSTPVLKHLKESLNIIERDDKFSVGVSSYGYRLTKNYRKSGFKFRNITDPVIKKSLLVYRKKKLAEQRLKLGELVYLTKWFIKPNLILDKEKALNYVEFFKNNLPNQLNRLQLTKKQQDEANCFIENTYAYSLHQIETWGKVPKLFVDNKGERLYTPLTNLLSPLRNFLTHNGEQLTSIDLKSSQPLHFLLTLNKLFWRTQGRYTLKRLNGVLWRSMKENNTVSTITMLLNKYHKNIETLDNKGFDGLEHMVPRYSNLVASGKLYQFISESFKDKFNKTGKPDPFDTVPKAKKQMLKLMYNNPKNPYTDKRPFELFCSYFPVEGQIMSELKSRDYRDFAILLQKLESHILLRDVCNQIFELDANIPIYTVHDSIITTTSNLEVVKGVIERTYFKLFGFCPKMTVEDLTPANAIIGTRDYTSIPPLKLESSHS